MKIYFKQATDKQDAFERVKNNVRPEILNEKFKVKATIEYNQDDYQVIASGSGFDLYANFFEDYIELDLKLSLLLRPLKSKILGALEKEIKRVV